MRSCRYVLLLFAVMSYYAGAAQLPPLQWANKYGGTQVDIPYTLIPTADQGTLAAGYTDSKDGDVFNIASRDYWDLWVTKLDRCGIVQWSKVIGGSGYESARDVIETADAGYLILGETNSTDGDVTAGYGGTKDMWLIKLSSTGTIEWQKRYGGSGLDIGNKIRLLPDGNFLVVLSTSSNDGQISGNHGAGGYTDAAIMKIDPNGKLLFSKCFGGSKNEELLDCRIINNRIYLAGYANSTDGDIPPSQQNYDVWVLALDLNFNKVYSKVYGGSQNDVAYSMTEGLDGSLTLAGYSTSNDGPVTGAHGSQDYWVLNIALNGTLNWQKTLGGSEADYANCVITDQDGGYLIAGISYSGDQDISQARGKGDFWVVKLAANGLFQWEQSYGGSGSDQLRNICFLPAANEYYLTGDSESADGDFTMNHGETDFAVIKLKQLKQEILDSVVCTLNDFVAVGDTLKDACGYDSLLVSYRPVLLDKAFGPRDRDTIFRGESVQLFPSGNGSISWDPDPTLSCSQCKNPIASPLISTTYVAHNSLSAHCSTQDQFTVVVLNDALVETPNAFTPNGDGRNDLFGPIGKVPEGYSMLIFNRNGELVFKSSSLSSRWDGRFRQQLQPTGLYVFLIDYKDLSGRKLQRKGTVTLIR